MRRCGRCHETKPVAEFAWRRVAKGQRDNYCRPCRVAYRREHYERNRQRYINAAAARRERVLAERMQWLVEFLEQHPCVDCGESDPLVLEFDHLRDKAFSIATALPSNAWSDIVREMTKCEVVCANCHRRRTARRGQFLRAIVVAERESTRGPDGADSMEG